jgi:hypothetical protein
MNISSCFTTFCRNCVYVYQIILKIILMPMETKGFLYQEKQGTLYSYI